MRTEVQSITDAEGNPVGVLVPIDLWREIASERETPYLLKSDAKHRAGGISLKAARPQFGI